MLIFIFRIKQKDGKEAAFLLINIYGEIILLRKKLEIMQLMFVLVLTGARHLLMNGSKLKVCGCMLEKGR